MWSERDGDFRQLLPGLAQGVAGHGKAVGLLDLGLLVVVRLRFRTLLSVLIVRLFGEIRIVFAFDQSHLLDVVADRRAVDLDHAGLAHHRLDTKCIAHRPGDDLQLFLVLNGERDDQNEEADEQGHQIGECHDPLGCALQYRCLLLHNLIILRGRLCWKRCGRCGFIRPPRPSVLPAASRAGRTPEFP